MRAKTTSRIRDILAIAERRVERLRSHAGTRNKSVDLAVVGLTELRSRIVKSVPR